MSYFEFPHTRTYEGDLGYIIKKLDELTKNYDSFFAYNSITFADPIQWNITTQYKSYTIVSDTATNASYISKQPVPAGIELSNSDYWEILGSTIIDPVARRAIENILARLNNIDNNISDINNDINSLTGIVTEGAEKIETERLARIAADEFLSSRIDNIIALEPGSTTGDAELTDIRLAYNGNTYPTAGDATRGQATMLETNIDNISAPTANLFDPDKILIGTNATGSANRPTRAISGAMFVGENGAKISVYGVPSNIDFDIERYSGDAYSTRTGADGTIGFIDEAGVYTYSFNDPYIRFLFRSKNNNPLTPADFSGLAVMVNAGLVVTEQVPFRTAKDNYARSHVDGITEVIKPFGLLPFSGYTNNSISGGTHPYASSYLLSDYVKVNPYDILECKTGRTNEYVIGVSVYDVNKNWIKASDYEVLYNGGFKLGVGAEYVRFTIRKANADLSTFYPIAPEESVRVNQVIGYADIEGDKLRLLTFNVGRWDYGTGFGIPNSIYTEKLNNYRRFFGEKNIDIMGLQECDRLIDEAQSIDFRNVLFNHWNYYSYVTGAWESILSKYNISGGHTGQLTSGRYYCDSYAEVNGKIIYLLAVHLTPGHGAEAAAIRADEMTEVLNLVSNKERFIIFGDFNPDPNEYAALFGMATQAGYNIANAGFFGDYWTTTNNPDDFNHYEEPTGTVYYMDNIITSANINIDYAAAINTYNKLSSDHIPVYAEVTIKE